MIQITDISALSALQSQLTSTVSAHGKNWRDEVYDHLEREYISPVKTQMETMVSDSDSCIRQIVRIYSEMEQIASRY